MHSAPTAQRPFVSVVINTYNYGRFIEEAIDSTLSQDFPMGQVEVLVVDDGSTDDTAERLKKYGSQIHYLHKPNGGQASAFNFGFQHARGEVVFLLDADDYFLPDKLRRVVEEFQKHPDAAMVHHSRLELDTETGEVREAKVEAFAGFLPDHKWRLASYELSPTSCLAFRRPLVEQMLPIPEVITLQADAFLGILLVLVAPVVALPEYLSVYRIHGQNLYHVKDNVPAHEKKLRRADMFMTILGTARIWAKDHKHALKQVDTQQAFGRWALIFQELRFKSDPPGRFSFFLFLLRENYNRMYLRTWKFTIFNYLTAFSALVFGYDRARMHDWQLKTLAITQRWFRKILGARTATGSKETTNRQPGPA
jgi:glycosyltransferase involved in cell wall biosynthesis